MRISLLAILLTISLAAFVAADCPVGDLDDTCEVDFNDVKIFAGQWLEDSSSIANLVGDDDVDFADFAVLAKNFGVIGQRTGFVEVVISPEAAVNAGAEWRLEDGPWRTTNEVVDVPIGPYTIEFSQIDPWFEPPERNVTVVEGLITGVRAPYKHPIVINEFLASNSGGELDPQGEDDDWLELYNRSGQPIDVNGMYLESDRLWRIPDGNPDLTTIDPCGYLLIWADGDVNDSGLHASFQLGADGDNIDLFDTDGTTLLDSIDYPDQDTNISYGRYPDGNDNWRYFSSPTPELANVGGYPGYVADTKFSHNRGFYYDSFSVTIATETEGATIRYTTDGSKPTTSHGTPYSAPVNINTTTCLRAFAYKPGFKPANVDTHTYIFPAHVVVQSQADALDAGYPEVWGYYNGNLWGDYEMENNSGDLKIVAGNPGYSVSQAREVIKNALKAIPTLSVATDRYNLFDPSQGIYMNPLNKCSPDGLEWERPASAEFFEPNGLREFQINCGIRIQGGASRQPKKCPKHSLSLRFRGVWGPARLNFPLFAGSPVESFDSLQLRAMFNNSWTHWNDSSNPPLYGQRTRGTMIRDQWIRDSLLDMGEISAGEGIFVHLYLNGMYWGVQNIHERQEASHYAGYFNADKDDIDAFNATECIDGTWTAWNEMKSIVSSRNWEEIQQVLDVDNYIDWTIIQRFGSNRDLKSTGNWRAAGGGPDRRPWRMYAWDSERVLEGVNEGGPADPPGLFAYLDDIEDFRMLFADRLHKHFFNSGPLTPETNIQRWTRRTTELDLAIIAESGRWGDYRRDVHSWKNSPYHLYTKNGHWLPEIERLLDDYFPYRTGKVLNQYKGLGLYPNIAAPVFRINDANQHGGYVSSSDLLSMVGGAGTIYYTTNGADPRRPGGAVNTPDAQTFSSAISLSKSTHIKARAKSGSTWSALNEAIFAVGPVAQNLRITEIMYHPQDTNDPNDSNEEFIELTNIGPGEINLNLVRFTNGVDFTCPNVPLAEGGHILVVKDQNAFEAEYGTGYNIAGEYFGSLNNGGERVELQDAAGWPILNFRYEDGWQNITDGSGYSLTIIDADNPDPNSWDLKSFWRASAYSGGSPGSDDGIFGLPNPGAVVINEVLANSDGELCDWLELHNTTASDVNIGGWYLSDNDSNLMKYRIADGTIIGPNGYMVFTEDANFGKDVNITIDPGWIIGFAFSSSGEEVCLSAADANGVLMGYREIEDFDASEPNVAFGLYTKSALAASAGDPTDFVSMSQNSKGLPNIYPPEVGPIVISEIAYHPNWPAWPVGGFYTNDSYEYIELRNTSLTEDVNLFRLDIDVNAVPWKFTDGIKYSFPTDAAIDANDYVVIARDPNAFSWRYPSVPAGKIFGPFERNEEDRRTSLDNGGENLVLGMPAGLDKFGDPYYIRIDRVNYSDGTHPRRGFIDAWPEEADGGGKSLTRKALDEFGNDPNNWQASTPLPGS